MSLEKEGSTFTAQCDFCNHHIDTDETDFLAAVDVIKRKGWKVFMQMKEWFHKCDECLALNDTDDFENVE